MDKAISKQGVFVVIYTSYVDGTEAYAFWKKEDAEKDVSEDAKAVVRSLQEQGYEPELTYNEASDHTDVYVPNGDIYYEWQIERTTIE